MNLDERICIMGNRKNKFKEKIIMERTKQEFVNEVVSELGVAMGEGYKVSACEVSKLNGIVLTSINVLKEGESIAPTLYIDDRCTAYLKGNITVSEVVEQLKGEYLRANRFCPSMDDCSVFDFNNVKQRICYSLVNRELNKEMLEDTPYIEFFDLAIIFKVYCEIEGQIGTIRVRDEFLKSWGVTVEELYEIAKVNTPLRCGKVITPMSSVIKEMMGGLEVPEYTPADEMYVATNLQKSDGSSVMLYKDAFKELADKLDADLYILPSSRHEVILLPVSSEIELYGLKQIVQSVNRTELALEDLLTDTVYMYKQATNEVVIA